MAHANDMTLLLNKIERRLQVQMMVPHLPAGYTKEKDWPVVIREDSLVEFSRWFPYKFRMQINESTCYKKEDETGNLWYYIKDEVLQGCKLLGIHDIDWTDHTTANASLGISTMLGNYYYPSMACPTETFDSILGLQMNADMASLYNRGIYIDFQYPNRFCLKGLANTNYDLERFVVILLIEHSDINTISPTKMTLFEDLCCADVANLLQGLKYVDNIETVFVNIDLKLDFLQNIAEKRSEIIEKMQESHVTMSNDLVPAIWTV